MSGHLLSSARRDREPWGLWLLGRRLWRALSIPFAALRRSWQALRLRQGGVDRTWRWYDRFWFLFIQLCTLLMALIFLAWLVRALVILIDRDPKATSFPLGFNTTSLCQNRAVECGAITGWVTSLLSLALASAVFLLWRLGRLRRRYLRTARRRPQDLVPTAGTILGDVVGRDELCRVIAEDLRVRRTRQPHVLVGGVGAGKTAVIVQLTELLARLHAVPVPIRLRDAAELDFTELAKKRFQAELDEHLSSTAEGEKVWRRLLRDDRIVVLADGLEEALAGDQAAAKSGDRDTQIRNAIRAANRRRLPLLVASRPHTPLRGMDATIHELEPLSEFHALSYVTEATATEDDWRLSWIIAMADVTEAPLYLQITRELNRLDMLDAIVPREEKVLQARTEDPSTLRLHLLQAWEDAMRFGRLYPEVPLTRREREATLFWLSAFACTGLRRDSIEVSLDDVRCDGLAPWPEETPPAAIMTEGSATWTRTGIDARLAAAWAAKLGLVEVTPNGVRFEHSLIEAYLGARLMDSALQDERYWREALGLADEAVEAEEPDRRRCSEHSGLGSGAIRPRPGREFLISLVLHSRRRPGEPIPGSPVQPPPIGNDRVCLILREAAGKHFDNKAIDIYTAALEIAGAPGHSAVPGASSLLSDIGGDIERRWAHIRSDDLQTLEEAKIRLVRRFGVALRTHGESSGRDSADPGYAQLFHICCQEESYRVRLAGAMEIGQGGSAAYRGLKDELALPHVSHPAAPARTPGRADNSTDTTKRWAWQISAWVVPLLITSTDPDCTDDGLSGVREELRQLLAKWVSRVREDGEGEGDHRERLAIWEEIALAQGFKYAANRRHGHLHTRPDAWRELENQAMEMLKHARYWFSELTLIQALTLWALPEGNEPLRTAHAEHDPVSHHKPGQDPDATVERWLDLIADKAGVPADGRNRPIHPFVEAAADLASRALAIRQPGRFLWMAESDAVSRVGAGQPKPAPPSARQPRWWIPPSLGWSALDPEAQQLLADVLVLLNLAERGEPPEKTKERLRMANTHGLPPCLSRDRRPLEPLLTVGTAESHQPGSSCLDGCRFQLCPYPPKGPQHNRAELSEEFCRRQYRLVRHHFQLRRRTARWQGMAPSQLRQFWSEMAERARNSPGT